LESPVSTTVEGTSPKVLVADDSPLVLRMVEKMLEGAGLSVSTARDGLEAIEKAFAEDFNLVILDVMMPRMTGYQACRLLKTEPLTKAVPVVILTSKDQAGDRFWGLETGADYYITKDAEPHRIVDLVRNILSVDGGPRPAREEAAVPRPELDILSRVNELLDRKLYQATVLSEISRVAGTLENFDETFVSVMGQVARVVDFTLGAMVFVEDEDELEVMILRNRPVAASVVEEAKIRVLEAVAAERPYRPLARMQARVLAPAAGVTGGSPETALTGFAAFPVLAKDRLSGFMALVGRAVSRIDGDTQTFLAQVAQQAHIVTENSRLFDRLRRMASRDSLTDLYNHRHSIEVLSNEFGRVGRYAQGLSLLMIDLDHFKRINDEHGHPTGDALLKEFARLLRDMLRAVDSVGRYGGEEFVVILPHTSAEEARQTADRIRRRVEGHEFTAAGKPLRVMVSAGVASYPSSSVDSPESLIREADKALYRAKQGGRNRVE
jgi:two-component system, cell cycle response regulator